MRREVGKEGEGFGGVVGFDLDIMDRFWLSSVR